MINKYYLTEKERASWEHLYTLVVLTQWQIKNDFKALRNDMAESVKELRTNFQQGLDELNKELNK